MTRRESTISARIRELTTIPGVGNSIAIDLLDIGISRISDLRGKKPEKLFEKLVRKRGKPIDRCVLYVFRCAIYFASTKDHDPKKLRWWYWKDGRDVQ